MRKTVFAATVAGRPMILCHGTDPGDVGVRALAKMAEMGFGKTRPLIVGTAEDLEEYLGATADALIRTYLSRPSPRAAGRRLKELEALLGQAPQKPQTGAAP